MTDRRMTSYPRWDDGALVFVAGMLSNSAPKLGRQLGLKKPNRLRVTMMQNRLGQHGPEAKIERLLESFRTRVRDSRRGLQSPRTADPPTASSAPWTTFPLHKN